MPKSTASAPFFSFLQHLISKNLSVQTQITMMAIPVFLFTRCYQLKQHISLFTATVLFSIGYWVPEYLADTYMWILTHLELAGTVLMN